MFWNCSGNYHFQQKNRALTSLTGIACLISIGLIALLADPNGAHPASQQDELDSYIARKLEYIAKNKEKTQEDESFHNFMANVPTEPLVVAKLPPNATEADHRAFRNKIKERILLMQEMDKTTTPISSSTETECLVEITRIEQVPGKCEKMSNGLPICRSGNHMIVTQQCT